MKTSKKILAIGLALALVFSSMGSVFAYSLNGVDYDGIQVNDTFYSAQYILGNKAAFGNIFGPADSSKVILDFNGNAAKFSDYLNANPADFDTWAAAHPTAATPSFLVKADGTKVPTIVVPPTLTVISVTALNRTTIEVKFSDNTTKTYSDYSLVPGKNIVTFTAVNGVSFTKEVIYIAPTATVEKIQFDNYRHFTVTFSAEVNKATAEDPANYYLELVDGNAEYSAAIMKISNQLHDIDTQFQGWWTVDANHDGDKDHIYSNVVGGKTVVDIFLPEDSRFTNELDLDSLDDDEETIIANMSNLVENPTGNNTKIMIKDVTVNVAVRNVRDLNGARTINTAVLPMLIQDNKAPQFEGFVVKESSNRETYGARQDVILHADGADSDVVALEFNEPVFDAHGLGVDDINNDHEYNIAVYVDNIRVGSKETQDLGNVLTFAMGNQDSYDKACFANLNVTNAIKKAYGPNAYKACRSFRISVVGITDLAGNTQNPNPVEFTAKLVDPIPNNTKPTPPVEPAVTGVKQIHDNAFRVFFNRAGVYANFEIVNADGEAGVLDVAAIHNNQTGVDTNRDGIYEYYYTDVFVPAVDIETTVGNEINGKDDGILAYDGQNTLSRKVRVYAVTAPADGLDGAAYCNDSFTITKDVYAPINEQPSAIEFSAIDSGSITIHMEDRIPDTWDFVGQPVYAMLYDYNYDISNPDNVFRPTIDVSATEEYNTASEPIEYPVAEGPGLLPIKVSYVKDGVTHAALVSNKWLSEDYSWPWINNLFKAGWNNANPDAIKYYVNRQDLVLDLSKYPQLTDNGKLIPGVTYTVEIPDGYFADPAKYDAYDLQLSPVPTGVKYEFDEVLYVSDGRQNNDEHSFIVRGYVANEMSIDVAVDNAPIILPPPVDDAVPQTSELLINYMQDANEIWVEFTGQIKQSTLEALGNYKVNGKTLSELGLAQGAVVFVKQATDNPNNADIVVRQFARIRLGYDTIPVSGDYTFDVAGVTNEAGGMMTPVSTRIDLIENTRPIVESFKISGSSQISQIMLTFDEALMYGDDVDNDAINAGIAATTNFEVILNGAPAVTPVTAVLSEADHKTVTLTIGADLSKYDTIEINIVPDQNGQFSLEDICDNHNPIKDTIVKVK